MGRRSVRAVTRRRALTLLTLTPLLALPACLLETRPRPAPPPTPTATPTRVPTATAASIALPTAGRPAPSPTPPVGPSRPAPAPAAPATPGTRVIHAADDPRAAGGLIYAGALDGRPGIVAVRAGGGARRLLTEGRYDQVAWSPDGGRFAAVGPLPDGSGGAQVALFTFNGRPLGRFPFPGRVERDLRWSPDGQLLLCLVGPAIGGGSYVPWVLGDDGARQLSIPGEYLWPLGWLAGNRLAFTIVLDGRGVSPYGADAWGGLWTIGADGQNGRWQAGGDFLPIGLAPSATALYALGDRQEIAQPGATGTLKISTTLLEIEPASGRRRVVARVADLERALGGDAPGQGPRWFSSAIVSPDRARIALWLRGARPGASPADVAPFASSVALVAAGGALGPIVGEPAGGFLAAPAWSPDGTALAYALVSTGTGENTLRVLDAARGGAESYPLDAAYTTALGFAWSPDSRWVAYRGPAGLAIVAGRGARQTLPLAPDGVAAAWRPEGGR